MGGWEARTMTKFLLCPKRHHMVHIEVCQSKCPNYDECEAREQFEVNQELEEEQIEMRAYEQMELRYMRL